MLCASLTTTPLALLTCCSDIFRELGSNITSNPTIHCYGFSNAPNPRVDIVKVRTRISFLFSRCAAILVLIQFIASSGCVRKRASRYTSF